MRLFTTQVGEGADAGEVSRERHMLRFKFSYDECSNLGNRGDRAWVLSNETKYYEKAHWRGPSPGT